MADTPAQVKAKADAAKAIKAAKAGNIDLSGVLIGNGQTGHPNKDTSITSKLFKKLDASSAAQLLQEAQKKAGYSGVITNADVNDFVAKFNAQSEAQARTVTGTIQSRLKPGATADDIANATRDVVTTVYPDYFNPRNFAKDFIWSKWTNPGTSKAFGGQALDALNQVRQLRDGWGSIAISDAEVNAYAKDVAMGAKKIGDVNAEIAKKGALNYPQFTDQINRVLATNPNATMYDIAQPYTNMMEQTLELPTGSVKLLDPRLDSALRPDGTAGKLPSQSLGDFKRGLMNSPEWEKTTAANQLGRSAATGLASAMGMGF